ncbi:MAG: tRNA (adenosine(37)-N6)-threonylcarbamoyltransferase complex ATPase subunit type 1 TsaE [Eubacteriaceae bacterium]|nr:tRNA (adenosine(37)-N6)-threonylcarbamoyltransferase complex ATPase subunit type 1 TsaE [Eubacteriaceae bacterium]
MKFESNSPEQTGKLGIAIGKSLVKGMVVCLDGEMGGGKTALSQGILRGLGVEGYITSPTYNIVNEYEKDGIMFYHFDVYRLESVEELYDIGFEEYLEDSIVIIEWAEKFRDHINGNILDIFIEKTGEINGRIIILRGDQEILRKIKEDSQQGE